MKNLKKQKLLVFIAVCAVSIIFAACGKTAAVNNSNTLESAETVSPPEETQSPYSDLPDVKMDGRIFTLLMPDYTIDGSRILIEEETGDTMDDAAYKVNLEMEERFDIKLAAYRGAGNDAGNNCYTVLSKLVMAGDDTVDLVMPNAVYGALNLITDGLLYNWLDMKYVDFSKPCWYASTVDAYRIKNTLYYVGGGAGALPDFMLFNKEMARNLGFESPYKDVLNGKWTFDKLIEFIKGAYIDVNGNGTKDKDDIYGYIANGFEDSFLWSSGITVAKVNEEGRPVLNLLGDRLALLIDKAYELFWSPDSYADRDSWRLSLGVFPLFAGGKALVIPWSSTYYAYYRKLDFDFGVLPYPKLTEIQENYLCLISGGIGIPINVKDPDNTSIIIQAYMEAAYKYVRPALIDVVLYGKLAQDAESTRIFEMILDSRIADPGLLYGGADSERTLGNIVRETTLIDKSTNFVSYYEKRAEKTQAEFDNIFNSAK